MTRVNTTIDNASPLIYYSSGDWSDGTHTDPFWTEYVLLQIWYLFAKRYDSQILSRHLRRYYHSARSCNVQLYGHRCLVTIDLDILFRF